MIENDHNNPKNDPGFDAIKQQIKNSVMKFSSLKSSFAATRARLGLSQQQLANHLGVAKATVGMAEIGRRKLPVPALLKLAQLEIKLTAASIPGTVALSKHADKDLPVYTAYRTMQLRESGGASQ